MNAFVQYHRKKMGDIRIYIGENVTKVNVANDRLKRAIDFSLAASGWTCYNSRYADLVNKVTTTVSSYISNKTDLPIFRETLIEDKKVSISLWDANTILDKYFFTEDEKIYIKKAQENTNYSSLYNLVSMLVLDDNTSMKFKNAITNGISGYSRASSKNTRCIGDVISADGENVLIDDRDYPSGYVDMHHPK